MADSITLSKIGLLSNAILAGNTQISGNLISAAGQSTFLVGDFNFSLATVTGLTLSFNNTVLTGNTTIAGPAEFQDSVVFNQGFDASAGVAILGDQQWLDGSIIQLTGTVALQGGILDFSGTTVTGLTFSPNIVNGNLTGNTTIAGTLAVSASSTFSGPVSITGNTTIAGGTLVVSSSSGFSGPVSITGALNVSSLATFTGILSSQAQQWNGPTITVPNAITFSGAGSLNFTGITVTGITVSSLVNGTISGNTTVTGTFASSANTTFSNGLAVSAGVLSSADQTWNGPTITLAGPIAFAGGQTIDFTNAPVNNVTMSGATTVNGPLTVTGTNLFTTSNVRFIAQVAAPSALAGTLWLNSAGNRLTLGNIPQQIAYLSDLAKVDLVYSGAQLDINIWSGTPTQSFNNLRFIKYANSDEVRVIFTDPTYSATAVVVNDAVLILNFFPPGLTPTMNQTYPISVFYGTGAVEREVMSIELVPSAGEAHVWRNGPGDFQIGDTWRVDAGYFGFTYFLN
jgi:hypothetical protein